MGRKAANMLRAGHTIRYGSGWVRVVAVTREDGEELVGPGRPAHEVVVLTLENGERLRRPPGAKIEVA